MERNEIQDSQMPTRDFIIDCVMDLNFHGKFYKLYSMIDDAVNNVVSDSELEDMKLLLEHWGVDLKNKSKAEILFEYTKLI